MSLSRTLSPLPLPLLVTRTGRRRPGLRTLATTAACVVAMAGMSGCDPASGNNGQTDGAGTAAAVDTTGEVIPEWVDERGTPLPDEAWQAIEINNKLGFVVVVNGVKDLKLSDSEPPQVLYGREIFTGELGFVKSRKLRVDSISEPDGMRLVQVDVSIDGPLPLQEFRSQDKDKFIPGPVITDTIGQRYYPIGWVIRDTEGTTRIEVVIDPSKQVRDLKELPRLSRARPQELRLLFRVSKGVTLNSYSYGGRDKYTFEMPVSDR